MFLDALQRFGAGCGIEIRGGDLRCVAVRSRPGGVAVLGVRLIEGFRERPPVEWGREYAAFLSACGLSHIAATVCLPRDEVVVRSIPLPPASAKERAAAVQFQLDSLHPFGDDEVYFAHAELKTGASGGPQPVAVVIAERARVDRYADLLDQAGVAAAAFTVSAAALYAALRVRYKAPPTPLAVAEFAGDTLEVYGESEWRPLLSADFSLRSVAAERALELAAADLRLDDAAEAALVAAGPDAEQELSVPPHPFVWKPAEEVFPAPLSAPEGFVLRRELTATATGLEAACPALGWRANLLPPDRRKSDSRWLWAPTAALVILLLLLGVGFLVRPLIQNRAYAAELRQRIAELQTTAAALNAARDETGEMRRKAAVLAELERRTMRDLEILSELSSSVPLDSWTSQIDIDDKGVRIVGEAPAAAPLLGMLNSTRTLEKAAFASSLVKMDAGERYQIVAQRRPTAGGSE